jgi:methionyl-tRNA formyltransferase
MRIAFFGLPLAAWLLHRDGHEIVYAGISRAGPGLRRVRRALAGGVELKPDVTSREVIERVRSLAPERIVSWFWTTRLPVELLEVAPRGAFGVHPSLLPRHRGPDPYFWAIDTGDAVTGVTAHMLAGEYDTGAILAQREMPIDPRWNAWQLARALDRPSLALLRELTRAEKLEGRAQDESHATLAPVPADEELEIDWTWTTARIERRVRAASPAPGAWAFFGDETLAITRVAPARSFPRALAPGEAAVVNGAAVVRTGDGAVELIEGRLDQGDEDAAPFELDREDWAAVVGEMAAAG